jgi:hypothetical protein
VFELEATVITQRAAETVSHALFASDKTPNSRLQLATCPLIGP